MSPGRSHRSYYDRPKTTKKKTKNNPYSSKPKATSDSASIDDDYYKYLKYQQLQLSKNPKQNSKSTNNLRAAEERAMIQSLPYDNFLKSK